MPSGRLANRVPEAPKPQQFQADSSNSNPRTFRRKRSPQAACLESCKPIPPWDPPWDAPPPPGPFLGPGLKPLRPFPPPFVEAFPRNPAVPAAEAIMSLCCCVSLCGPHSLPSTAQCCLAGRNRTQSEAAAGVASEA